ncbi:tyrosine-type recombinase/integrase [Pelagibacterium mangrovi]|uniref:tyrosine-type recombinase/integrase n=1 Tax=Pelagibacterium mangrovi TaxID=3119828 RepID=UPI002FCAFE42
MPRKSRPVEPEFQAILHAFLEFSVKRKGSGALAKNVETTAAKSLSAFMTANPGAPLSFEALVSAKGADVEEFLGQLQVSTAASYRYALKRFFDYLVAHGHANANPADECELVLHAPLSTQPALTEEEWDDLLALVGNETRHSAPWIAARNVAVLTMCRSLSLLPGELDRITVQMFRSGVVRVEKRRRTEMRVLKLDDEPKAAISRYLALLPTKLDDEDALFRRADLQPARMSVVLNGIKVRAREAGIRFRINLIPPKRRIENREEPWPSSDVEVDLEKLFVVFRQLHPRWTS